MFDGWQRADVISALALGVSGLAFMVSLCAAGFTFVQTRIAQRKAKEDKAAKAPSIEPSLSPTRWAGWYRLQLSVRNRLDTAIVCEELKIRTPRNALVVTLETAAGGKRNPNGNGNYMLPDEGPATDLAQRTIQLEEELKASGSRTDLSILTWHHDERQIELLVFVPSSSSASRRRKLEISLSSRLSSESEPYADSIVVTKIPTVRTSKDA